MNRRSFFGFACGGAVVAPLALVGEKAAAHPQAVSELLPGAEARQVVTVSVDGIDGDIYMRQLVRDEIAKASEASRRGGRFMNEGQMRLDYMRREG